MLEPEALVVEHALIEEAAVGSLGDNTGADPLELGNSSSSSSSSATAACSQPPGPRAPTSTTHVPVGIAWPGLMMETS
eukprot:477449-Prymnesium_polylepis.1